MTVNGVGFGDEVVEQPITALTRQVLYGLGGTAPSTNAVTSRQKPCGFSPADCHRNRSGRFGLARRGQRGRGNRCFVTHSRRGTDAARRRRRTEPKCRPASR